MRVMAQMAMVMNLDKCSRPPHLLGHLQAGVDQPTGTEYVWFNNVETRPGQGYPAPTRTRNAGRAAGHSTGAGRFTLRSGSRLRKLFTIFSNPKMPSIDDYYEPWTYDYETLTNARCRSTRRSPGRSRDQRRRHEDPVERELGRQPGGALS
jgi:nitrate reductase beta subunit